MADNNNGGDGIVAFLLGGIVGAALGLLLAPRKGEETREILSDWIEENRLKTSEFIAEERDVLAAQKDKLEAAWEAGKKVFTDPSNGKSKHA